MDVSVCDYQDTENEDFLYVLMGRKEEGEIKEVLCTLFTMITKMREKGSYYQAALYFIQIILSTMRIMLHHCAFIFKVHFSSLIRSFAHQFYSNPSAQLVQ